MKDLAGNARTSDKVWPFTTGPDTSPPLVINTDPGYGDTGVPVTKTITATFNEPVLASSVSTSTFIVKNSADVSISGTVSLTQGGTVATFAPSSSLASSTSYTATIKGGSTGVKDMAGNARSSNKVWPFTTPATTANRAGLYVPLFTYPTSSMWSTLISTKNNHPNLPIIVTVNPSSGVGSSQDSNFVTGINNLKSAGITVLGYVYTDYGQRSASVIQDEISKYKSWYGVNGIFFDEMSVTAGKESYYSSLNSYVKSVWNDLHNGKPWG